MERIWQLSLEALDFLSAWFEPSTIASLIVAFFMAGAIVVFISREVVLKYFSSEVNRFISYSVATVAGTLLTVWSCTVIPLFSGIYRRGAGLGPAMTFLYAAPVINVITIIYSMKLLGMDIAIGRTIGTFIFAIVLGLMMAFIFRKEEREKRSQALAAPTTEAERRSVILQVVILGILVVLLVLTYRGNWIATGVMLVVLGAVLWRWFTKSEVVEWIRQTWMIFYSIVPLVLIGAFIAGVVFVAFPSGLVIDYAGHNDLLSVFRTSLFGVIMYFCSLCEVPIVRAFLDLGMAGGPALALLLTGPAFSLPTMLVLFRIIGAKKTLACAGLALILATTMGFVFGQFLVY